MKYTLLGLISSLLFVSLTGCAIPQRRSIYIYTAKKYCTEGLTLMTDNTCRDIKMLNKPLYSSKGTISISTSKKHRKKAIKAVKREINCKQVLVDINQCTK